MVWNLRTFSEQDFDDVGERLLPPKPLGLSELPRELAGAMRRVAIEPLGTQVEAPAGVAYYMFGGAHVFYNFLDQEVEISLKQERLRLAANGWLWR
jgi:hypothetical protein